MTIFSCSKQEASKTHSVNADTDGLIAYADDAPDALAGGDGITIGNGNSSEGEVDEEVAKPEIIIGSYLACSIVDKNIVSCSSETKLSESDLEQIILIDQNGNEISSDDIEVNIVEHGESFEMILTVSSDVALEGIKESGDTKITEKFCESLGTPGSWVLVPGDPDYGTEAFCVMKYEAKDSSGVPTSAAADRPWVNISQTDAIAACTSLGEGFHLITNNEWMTIGANIANQGGNWDGGTVGINELVRGHSDGSPGNACAADASDANAYVETDCTGSASGTFNQRRTHTLSNGRVIWDFAGNVSEWTSYFNDADKPYVASNGSPVGNWREYTLVDTFGSMAHTDLISQAAIDGSWTSAESIGQYYAGNSGSGGALRRGGKWDNSTNAGVFTARLNSSPTRTATFLGFRCAVAAP